MKKLFITITLIAFIGCSTSKEDRAKKLIKEHLMETLKDPSSYDPVAYGPMDSIFFPYIDTKEGRELFELGGITGEYRKKALDLHDKAISSNTRADLEMYGDSSDYYMNKSKETEDLFNENNKNYKGEFIGWVMEHRFRAKNSMGGFVFEDKLFFFNIDVTKIEPPYGNKRI